MELDKAKFSEYLTCYGSDIRVWSEEARALGLRAQHHPEYAALIEKEKYFERRLRKDGIPSAPSDLVTRILTASLSKPMATEPLLRFFEMKPYLNPAALAAILILGIAVGFTAFTSTSQDTEESFLQSYSDDEEMTL